MLSIQLSDTNFWQHSADSLIFFVQEGTDNNYITILNSIEQEYNVDIKTILKKEKFEGKKGQIKSIYGKKGTVLVSLIFVGLGKQHKNWHVNLEMLRRALGSAVIQLKRANNTNAFLELPNAAQYNISQEELIKQLTITALMAEYEFTAYKSTAKDTNSWQGSLTFTIPAQDKQQLANAIKQGIIIGHAMNEARAWCDTPGNIMTPTALSKEAERIAQEQSLTCTIFGRERALELGMGAYLAVESGSDQDGKFVILEYKTKEKNAPTIALVGKGVTYDTGGISLKQSSYMTGMHYDMSGAAAVIATMKIISELKPDINVIGITPLVENMPSGKAARQDDIVRCMNGKTVEIKNTDAEGRLILSDALCYAEKFYNPEVIIDIATLTGACLYALGYFYTGLMTQDEDLLKALPTIGNLTGDRVWPLPLDDDFKPANNSLVADVSNSGSNEYKAGTIIGACFLQEFVKNAKWAHLDIAGTADSVPGISYLGKTSAGAGIRLFVEFIMNYKSYIQ